jgi:hypothetical protein
MWPFPTPNEIAPHAIAFGICSLPCHLVDAGRGGLLETEEARSQTIHYFCVQVDFRSEVKIAVENEELGSLRADFFIVAERSPLLLYNRRTGPGSRHC